MSRLYKYVNEMKIIMATELTFDSLLVNLNIIIIIVIIFIILILFMIIINFFITSLLLSSIIIISIYIIITIVSSSVTVFFTNFLLLSLFQLGPIKMNTNSNSNSYINGTAPNAFVVGFSGSSVTAGHGTLHTVLPYYEYFNFCFYFIPVYFHYIHFYLILFFLLMFSLSLCFLFTYF